MALRAKIGLQMWLDRPFGVHFFMLSVTGRRDFIAAWTPAVFFSLKWSPSMCKLFADAPEMSNNMISLFVKLDS